MPDEDWRSPTAYDYVSGMSSAGFAFEFLRRNVDYQNDFRNFEGTGRRSTAHFQRKLSGTTVLSIFENLGWQRRTLVRVRP
jgi:hypothetical protein